MAKKGRKSRNDHINLYIELEQNDQYTDTRYYGVFKKNDKIHIDPKRFCKKFPGLLDEKMLDVINHRNTHFFIPKKRKYYDYNVNIFLEELNKILNDWESTYYKQVKSAIKQLKIEKHTPGNDYLLTTGIDSYGAANARANWLNMMEESKYQSRVHEIISSMYSQFFHMMASRIEAVTIRVLSINSVKVNKSLRDVLKGTLIRKKPIEEVEGFNYHDKLYRIWNFIKHNNEDAYKKLKAYYPETLFDEQYKEGDLAIHYVKFDNNLIVTLLEGLKLFFINYCSLVFEENLSEASWNYDAFFLDRVYDEIEVFENPLGLDIFSDID